MLASLIASALVASMSVLPSSGTFHVGQAFNAAIVIDGNGQAFNAAQATVSISPNLKVVGITPGDCNFTFINAPAVNVATPSANNPSFVGAILGGSSTKCTVETVVLSVVKTGKGSVMLSNVEVKAYADASDLLGTVNSGTYSLVRKR